MRSTHTSSADASAGYRSLSLWHDDASLNWTPRDPLPGPCDVDVAIVGGGYTGLWTAYYLAKADPSLRIAVLEREVVGFGASGRNGGWCSAIFPATLRKVAATGSRDAARRMQTAMNNTVGEIDGDRRREHLLRLPARRLRLRGPQRGAVDPCAGGGRGMAGVGLRRGPHAAARRRRGP